MSFHQWILDSKIIDTEFQCDHRIRLAFFFLTFLLHLEYWELFIIIIELRGLEEFETLLRHDQGHSSICFVFLIHDIDDFILNIACISL